MMRYRIARVPHTATSATRSKREEIRPSRLPSTITAWLRDYRQHCTYRRLRPEGLRRFSPEQTLRSIKLYHRQVYGYAYHRPKLEFVRDGTLDEKRTGDRGFATLADFLESIPTMCPHDLFRREDDPKARAPQAHPAFVDVSRIIVNSKRNAATEAAGLIIPAVGNNKLRHETLQRFMRINDSVTLAIVVPIWLTEEDIAALEDQHGIELAPRIDGAESRHHRSHRFPASKERRGSYPRLQARRPHKQTHRAAGHLRSCAHASCPWSQALRHQVREYCEFFPRTLFAGSRLG